MKNILIIADKFKGSLSAREVSCAIERGLKKERPDIDTVVIPLADGGDGTIEAIERFADESIDIQTVDPYGKNIQVPILRIGNKVLCEMAKSTGLWRLSKEQRNPLKTSSYGFGLVIRKAAELGFSNILLGIGGSATNDAGVGMLQALGYRFFDKKGDNIGINSKGALCLNGSHLQRIAFIDKTGFPEYISSLKIEVACDVNNPLTGIYGATKVYGPQKGATPRDLEFLESGVAHFATLSRDFLGFDCSEMPGAGAAGGVGFALAAFCNATLKSGWKILFDLLDIEQQIKKADLVITGEGRVDGQSLSGKLLDGAIEMTIKHKKPLWVFCGDNLLTERELEQAGIDKLFSISQLQPYKQQAIANGASYLEKISQNAATFL